MRAEPTPIGTEQRQVAVVALLPMLAGAPSAATGLALGVVLAAVLLLTRATAASFAAATTITRLVLCTLVAGSLTICSDLAMHAWLPELHAALGPFLLATAPAALLHASVSARVTGAAATLHAAALPIMALAMLGACRELLGAGTLLADAGLLVGIDAAAWQISTPWRGFLAATELPGALFAAALLVALGQRKPAVAA